MSEIMLKSDILKVIKINKKTTTKLFKDLVVGDEIILNIPVKRSVTGYRSTRVRYITVEVIKTGEKVQKSFNEISNILDAFEFEVVDEAQKEVEITEYMEKIKQECNHKKRDGTSAVEYCSTYEMRSNDMYCTLCGKNGSRKDLA